MGVCDPMIFPKLVGEIVVNFVVGMIVASLSW